MSPMARLLTLAIRNEADDQGVFEWKPVTIKMRLMPADNVDVSELLAEMEANNQVRRFEWGGRQFGVIRNFGKFQRPKKPNKVHFLPHELRTYASPDGEGSEEVPDQFPTDTEIPPQMEEVVGNEEIDISLNSRACGTSPRQQCMSEKQREADAEFEHWWLAYPRRVGKGKARKSYRTARANTDAETLLAATKRYADSVASKDPEFIAHPATWLNGERWLDEPARKPPEPTAGAPPPSPTEYDGSDAKLAEMWNAGKRNLPQFHNPQIMARLRARFTLAEDPPAGRRTA